MSLNWASICGIILAIYGIPAGLMGVVQLFFVLQRRANTSTALIIKSIFLVFQSFGRLIMLPLSGGILFFQGWRLDPVLQFCIFLIVLGIIFESAVSITSDIQKWRFHKKRKSSNIAS